MRSLVKILLGGFVIFMLLAIADEWSFFSSAWFGEADPPQVELDDGDRAAAVEAVRLALNLARHLYQSGGDPRFAERMPVSDGMLAEMLTDIEYLRTSQRLQDPQLRKLEVLEIVVLSRDRVEVRTREFWRHQFVWLDGSGEAEPEEWQILFARYLVERGPKGWEVQGWEVDESKASAGEPPPSHQEAVNE